MLIAICWSALQCHPNAQFTSTIFAARCYASVAYAVMRCLSVTFVETIYNYFHRRVTTPC